MPQKVNPCAAINWSDTSMLHIVDLIDGTETKSSYGFQEAAEDFVSFNGFVGEQITLIDNGAMYLTNFDGKMEPYGEGYGAFGGDSQIRVFSSMNLAVVRSYDNASGNYSTKFINTTDDSVIRTVSDSEQIGGVNHGLSNIFNGVDTNSWQGNLVWLLRYEGSVDQEKLHAYDPVTNTLTVYPLPQSHGRYYETWNTYVYNDKLHFFPIYALNAIAPDMASSYEVDASWNITAHEIPELQSLADRQVTNPLFTLGSLDLIVHNGHQSRYVRYVKTNNGVDYELLTVDLSTMAVTLVIPEVPVLSFDHVVAGISVSDKCRWSSVDDIFFSFVPFLIDNSSIRHNIGKIFVWNASTGELLREIPVSLDGYDVGLRGVWAIKLPVYEVTGTITRNGNPAEAKVELMDINNQRIMGEKMSGLDGTYSFRCYSAEPKTILAHHPLTNAVKPSGVLIPAPVMV